MANTNSLLSSIQNHSVHPVTRWMGAVLRYHREQAHMTQIQMGAILNLSIVQWCRVEQGNRALSDAQFLQLCTQLGWDPHTLHHQARLLHQNHVSKSGTAVWRFAASTSFLNSLRDTNNGALSTE